LTNLLDVGIDLGRRRLDAAGGGLLLQQPLRDDGVQDLLVGGLVGVIAELCAIALHFEHGDGLAVDGRDDAVDDFRTTRRADTDAAEGQSCAPVGTHGGRAYHAPFSFRNPSPTSARRSSDSAACGRISSVLPLTSLSRPPLPRSRSSRRSTVSG